MNRNSLRALPLAGLAGLLLIMSLGMGCQRVAPIRTLPSWVRGIYIPMFKNETFEPQVEEVATRCTQEAFLADGRLDIVPREKADLVLVVKLLNWQSETVHTRNDKIASSSDITLTVSVQLFDPFDLQTPRADLGKFRVSTYFYVDTRSNLFEPEPDRKERLMNALAGQIVMRVINGFPTNVADLPPGTAVPQFRTPETIQFDSILQPRKEQDLQQH